MTTQEKLLEALFKTFPGESETAIARRCGLSIARFSNYKLGKRDMDVDAVIGCAQVLGWNVRETVAAHEIETAPTPRVKALWRKLAATAALLFVGISGGFSHEASAASQPGFGEPNYTLCEIMHRRMARLGYYWKLLKLALERLLQRPKASPENMEAFACL